MKLCRFQPLVLSVGEVGLSDSGTLPEPRFGLGQGETVREITGDLFGAWTPSDRIWRLDQLRLLPPVTPSKIVCIGRNYHEHAAELGNPVPKEPLIFLKPPSAVIGPDEPIVLPAISHRVDHEGELAIIIGRRCSQLAPDADVRPYILGFTCLNDVTARDIQKADVQFTRGKGFDTFCPLGPVVETQLDLSSAVVSTFVNGSQRQSAPVTQMIFPVDVIIRWISRVMTLEPGDVIATGTPAGVGPLAAGDVVEVVVTGIGTLRNPVVAQP
jgi:2-keto-4-pentenoate hydratase/2-oxohepta-3-ene-1,7-dioic acid hydratase in catechol pathway